MLAGGERETTIKATQAAPDRHNQHQASEEVLGQLARYAM